MDSLKAGCLEITAMCNDSRIFNVLLDEGIFNFIFWSDTEDGGGVTRWTFVRKKSSGTDPIKDDLIILGFDEIEEDEFITFRKNEFYKNSIDSVKDICLKYDIFVLEVDVSAADNKYEVLECVKGI